VLIQNLFSIGNGGTGQLSDENWFCLRVGTDTKNNLVGESYFELFLLLAKFFILCKNIKK
jgi:hypothetical protein